MEFAQYWHHTDAVSKTLFFILLALSVLSWIVGIMRVVASKKLSSSIHKSLSDEIYAHKVAMTNLTFDQQKTAVEQLLLQRIARYRFEAEKGLAILGTTASIAPFIGLFGTVWGIFHALHKIGQSGEAGLAQVAGPVGEALIMTGLGLAVAIPAVIFYNISIRTNKQVMHTANDTAHEILSVTAQTVGE